MAYIKPTSEIYLFEDIKINSSYDDTFTFFDKNGVWDSTAQATWFLSKRYVTLTDYSFVGEGVIRVKGAVGNYEKVNYMMFKNSDFSNKWFYAFVNSVEYTNPGTTTLNYTLDVMQTWLGELEILPSLVDREHVEDDSLYANLEPEGISVNERIPYSKPYNLEGLIGDKMVVLGFTEDPRLAQTDTTEVPYNPFDYYPNESTAITGMTVLNISNQAVQFARDFGELLSQTKGRFIIPNSVQSFTFDVNIIKGTNIATVTEYHVKCVYNSQESRYEFSEYI